MTWTTFWDMHSGGGNKEAFDMCFIEAPREEAERVFYARFGHNPNRVSCTCCGSDYSISEDESLEQATAYHRGCRYVYKNQKGQVVPESEGWRCGEGVVRGYWGGWIEEPEGKSYSRTYVKLKDYLKRSEVCVIRAEDIKPSERRAELPEQGYVWRD